jgi:hypothetical protein
MVLEYTATKPSHVENYHLQLEPYKFSGSALITSIFFDPTHRIIPIAASVPLDEVSQFRNQCGWEKATTMRHVF